MRYRRLDLARIANIDAELYLCIELRMLALLDIWINMEMLRSLSLEVAAVECQLAGHVSHASAKYETKRKTKRLRRRETSTSQRQRQYRDVPLHAKLKYKRIYFQKYFHGYTEYLS